MARIVNIDAAARKVEAVCAKYRVSISALEEIPGGGTRIVLADGRGAAIIRRAFRDNLLPDSVRRFPLWAESWY